jgi:diguanylate cyclase (GGDEF)-like protein
MEMGLRAKILSFFLVGFILVAVLGTLLLRSDLEQGFDQIEKYEAQQLNDQFSRNLTAELEHLNELNTDWANWDGMYKFATTLDPKFSEEDIGPGALTSAKITFVEILDTEHKRRFFRAVQAAVGLQSSADGSPFDEAIAEVQKALLQPEAQSACGLHASSLGPLLMCWQPIHRTDQGGRSPGTLITGRFLDDYLIAQIREQSGIHLQVEAPAGSAKETPFTFHPKVEFEAVQLAATAKHVLTGRVLDFAGHPVIAYKINIPGDVEENGREISRKVVWGLLISVALTGIVLLVGVHFLLVRPLRALQGQLGDIQGAGKGLPKQIIVSQGSDEIAALGAAVNRLLDVIHKQLGSLEGLSLADPLTRIANRRAFEQRLTNEMRARATEHTPLSLILADVDYFKQYNDRHGQLHGDKILQRVAEVIKSVANRPSDLVARLDGAEFAILLSNTGVEAAKRVAEDLRAKLAARALLHQNSPISGVVTLSIGVTPAGDENGATFLSRAGRAVLEARQAGGDRILIAEAPTASPPPRGTVR